MQVTTLLILSSAICSTYAYSTEGFWADITQVRIAQCEEAPNCKYSLNGTEVIFDLGQPEGIEERSFDMRSSDLEVRSSDGVYTVKATGGKGTIVTGSTNPSDIYHRAYDICYASGSCDNTVSVRQDVFNVDGIRPVSNTVILRASGKYWDGNMGGYLINLASKFASQGQVVTDKKYVVRNNPIQYATSHIHTGVSYIGLALYGKNKALNGFMDLNISNIGAAGFECGRVENLLKAALQNVPGVGPYIGTLFDVICA